MGKVREDVGCGRVHRVNMGVGKGKCVGVWMR